MWIHSNSHCRPRLLFCASSLLFFFRHLFFFFFFLSFCFVFYHCLKSLVHCLTNFTGCRARFLWFLRLCCNVFSPMLLTALGKAVEFGPTLRCWFVCRDGLCHACCVPGRFNVFININWIRMDLDRVGLAREVHLAPSFDFATRGRGFYASVPHVCVAFDYTGRHNLSSLLTSRALC